MNAKDHHHHVSSHPDHEKHEYPDDLTAVVIMITIAIWCKTLRNASTSHQCEL